MDSIPTEWEKLTWTASGGRRNTSTFTKLTAPNSDDLDLWLVENMGSLPRICRFNEHALPSDIPYLVLCPLGSPDAKLQRKTITGKFKLIGATKLPRSSLSSTGEILSLLFMNVANHDYLMQVQPLGTQKAEGRACDPARNDKTSKKSSAKEIDAETAMHDEISDKECVDGNSDKSKSDGVVIDAASSSARRYMKPKKTIRPKPTKALRLP